MNFSLAYLEIAFTFGGAIVAVILIWRLALQLFWTAYRYTRGLPGLIKHWEKRLKKDASYEAEIIELRQAIKCHPDSVRWNKYVNRADKIQEERGKEV